MKIKLGILTNAHAADQRTMIGYGEMLLEAARETEHEVVEFRPASLFGRLLSDSIQDWPRRLANNLDRFIVTPLKLAGKNADIVHVVDPGNAVYLLLIRHRRSIVTVHDMIPYLARDGKLPGLAAVPYRALADEPDHRTTGEGRPHRLRFSRHHVRLALLRRYRRGAHEGNP